MFNVRSVIAGCSSAIKSQLNKFLAWGKQKKASKEQEFTDYDFQDFPDVKPKPMWHVQPFPMPFDAHDYMQQMKSAFFAKKSHAGKKQLTELGEDFGMYHECESMTRIGKSSDHKLNITFDDNDGWSLFIDNWSEGRDLTFCPYCLASLEPWKNQVTIE